MFPKAVSNIRSENASRWHGAAFAVGIFFSIYLQASYFGQIAGMPSMVISYAALLALLCAAAISIKDIKSAVVYLPILLIVAVLFSALMAASADQWSFLFDPGRWSMREQDYRLAKLTKIILYFIPMTIALTCLVLPREHKKVFEGVCVGLVVFGALAATRVLFDNWNVIIATPLEEARKFYANPRGFSLVSYAYLLSTAALASLRLKRGWILSGFFLFVLLLLNRRYETLVTMFLIAVFSMWFIAGRSRNRASPYALALGLAILLIVPLHNGYNTHYFTHLGLSIQQRVDMVRAIFGDEEPSTEPPFTVADGEGRALLDTQIAAGPRNVDETERHQYEIAGLGNYQQRFDSRFRYPHNVIVEAYLETGILSVIFIVSLLFVPIGIAIFKAFIGAFDETAALAIALLLLVFGASLKAGDIIGVTRIAAFASISLLTLCDRARPRRVRLSKLMRGR